MAKKAAKKPARTIYGVDSKNRPYVIPGKDWSKVATMFVNDPRYTIRYQNKATRRGTGTNATPASPGGGAAATPAVGPHLDPGQMLQESETLGGIAWDRTTVEQDLANARAEHDANIPKIQQDYAAGVKTTGEQLGARGMSSHGVSAADLQDTERIRVIQETDNTRAFQRAKERHDALLGALERRQQGAEFAFAAQRRANAVAGSPAAAPVAATPRAPAGPAGTAPGGGAAPGSRPQSQAGPSPGPGYAWTGFQWVKVGTASKALAGAAGGKKGLPSGPPPSPKHFWNGIRWVKRG